MGKRVSAVRNSFTASSFLPLYGIALLRSCDVILACLESSLFPVEYASAGNVYLEQSAPWSAIKNQNPAKAPKSLAVALTLCRSLAIVASPILPNSTDSVWEYQLHLPGKATDIGNWSNASSVDLPDLSLGLPKPLYSKIDDAELARLVESFSTSPQLEEIIS